MRSPTVATAAGGSSSSSALPMRSRTQAKYIAFKLASDVIVASLHIVPAGVERKDRRDPEQHGSDENGTRQHRLARRARDEKPEGEQLRRRLPFRDRRHGNRHAQFGEILTQARN